MITERAKQSLPRLCKLALNTFIKKRTWSEGIILILTFCAFFLRMYKLDASSIWYDEAIRLSASLKSEQFFSTNIYYSIYQDVILKIWINLTPYKVEYLRLFSVICGTLIVPLTFLLAKKVSNRMIAIFVAGLVAVSPILIIYSQEICHYMPASVLVLVQTIILSRWVKNYSYLDGGMFGVVSLILSNVLPQSFFLTVGFLIYFAWSTKLKGNTTWKSFILSILIFTPSMLYFIWGINFANTMGDRTGGFFTHFEFSSGLIDRIMTGLFNIPNPESIYAPRLAFLDSSVLYLRMLFGGLFIISIVWSLLQPDGILKSISFALLIFLIGTGVGILSSNQFYERYFVAVQPLALIVFISFISDMIHRVSLSKVPLILFLVLLMSFWGIMTQKSAYEVAWKPKNKEAFTKLIECARNTNEAFCIVPDFFEWPIADFYLKNISKVALMGPTFEWQGQHLRAALLVKEDHYVWLAMKQIKDLKDMKRDNIFLYTQRGSSMIPPLKEFMKPEYEDEKIYNDVLIVIKFKRKIIG